MGMRFLMSEVPLYGTSTSVDGVSDEGALEERVPEGGCRGLDLV